MKLFFKIIILSVLVSLNPVFAADSLYQSQNNKNIIECSAEATIKYVPIKGLDNSSLMYAVLINPKEKKYRLITDNNNNIKCVFN